MANIHVNDFDRANFKYVTVPGNGLTKEVASLSPVIDSGAVVTNNFGPQVEYHRIPFGSLNVGTSVPPALGTVATTADEIIIQGGGVQLVPGYTTATVDKNPNAAGQAQSQAFYLLPTFGLTSIAAALIFDLPLATSDAQGTEDHSANKWAVAIVLKNGTKNELPTDTRIFASCQFKSGGVYLPAQSGTIPVDVNTFATYAAQGTQFQLSLTLLPGAQSITASLAFGSKTATGQLPFTAANLAAVTAIGVSLACPTNSIFQTGARFKSFTITTATGIALHP